MEGIFRIAAIAAAGALCAVSLRRGHGELSLLLGICTSALMIGALGSRLVQVLELVTRLGEEGGLDDGMILPLIRITGISIVTNLTVQTCREAGEGTVAAAAELAGAVFALVCALPMLERVLEQVEALL